MGLFNGVDAAASAMSAERLRMTVAAENLAHAGDTSRGPDGLPYARQRVIFKSVLDQQGQPDGRVESQVVSSPRYERRIEPGHPDADADGVVMTPSIDPILELTDLMIASKSYDSNANAVRGLMRLHESALRIGQSG
ncbi:flagellar basal-body rod protein FlgC [Planctomycetota bacterium]|nr:flagellar basal-body rod protein FlgC [Planctomycetota bacterium]